MPGEPGESPATFEDRFFEDPPLITSEDVAALAPEWAALHASIPGAPPFAHPDWTAAWLRTLAPKEQPVYLAVRLGEERTLIGVVPLLFGPEGATFAGDPEICDFAPVLVQPGDEEIACSALVEWLMEDLTPALATWGVPAESPLRPALHAAAERFGWTCKEEVEALSPRVALPGDWDGYLATLSKKQRHELRRKLKHLEEAGTVTLEAATAPDEVSAVTGQLIEMMRASRDDKDAFLTPEREAFFRDLAPTLAAAGLTRLVTMSLDGAPVATLFTFESGDTTYLYNSGYDPSHAHLGAGLLSKALVLRDAQDRGQHWLDFLRGDERYKFHLGCEEREVVRLGLRG